MIYKRYEFIDQAQAEEKIDAFFDLDEEGSKVPNTKASFINLGKLVIVQGEYDSEGVETIVPAFNIGWAVDALWDELGESPYGWKSYEVEPANPKHKLFQYGEDI